MPIHVTDFFNLDAATLERANREISEAMRKHREQVERAAFQGESPLRAMRVTFHGAPPQPSATPTPAQQIGQAARVLRQRIQNLHTHLTQIGERLTEADETLEIIGKTIEVKERLASDKAKKVELVGSKRDRLFDEAIRLSEQHRAIEAAIKQIGSDPQIRPGLDAALAKAKAQQKDVAKSHGVACDDSLRAIRERDEAQTSVALERAELHRIEQERRAGLEERAKLTKQIGEFEAALKALEAVK